MAKVDKSLDVKRKIELLAIGAITKSTHPKSYEFVIHIQKEYDYRYTGIE
jgi:hypothetical protein